VVDKNIKVHQDLLGRECQIRLKCNLLAEALEQWDELMRELATVALSLEHDSMSWALESSGIFSSHSLYLKLNQGASIAQVKYIWGISCLS
jgi:hypothetical protein